MPKVPSEITQFRLKELLHYDPETGVFTRRVARRGYFAGSVAGYINRHGYISINVHHKDHYAHRLAFLYMTGVLPPEDVDHRDGVRDNNAWSNLRSATRSQNNHNIAGPQRNNRSGFLGVSWHKASGKWESRIMLNGKKYHLGLFTTPEAAYAAHMEAKNRLHPTHLRLRDAA